MKYKKLSVSLVLSGFLLAASSYVIGSDSSSKIQEAQVISASPVYRTVETNTPKQQCWEEAVAIPEKKHQSYTAELIGAALGAAVGYQFGSGRGQDAATVAGAVIGGSIGHDTKYRNNQVNSGGVRYEQRCKTVHVVHSEERLEGYDVTYRYDGEVYSTRTRNDPGDTIRVSVSVVPVE